jgi:hypothetical protein
MARLARANALMRGGSGRAIESAALVRALEEAHKGPAWHGPSLHVTLRHCTIEEAQFRVATHRNTIWELVLHIAYGKHVVRNRLTGSRERFARPLRRSWWPATPPPSDAAWREDLALLESAHEKLVSAVAAATPAALARRRARKRHDFGQEVLGVALHDTYHAGQITLLRKLFSLSSFG